MSNLTSPREFFGVMPGDDRTIIRWDKICDYFDYLGKQSPCIKVIDMGDSTEGNRFLQVIITSEQNMNELEKYRKMSLALADPRGMGQDAIDEMVKRGKAVCVQSMSLHAVEIGGTQMSPLLAYDLLTSNEEDVKRILDEVIFVMVPCFNPDGQIMVCDWYNSHVGTKDEDSILPTLYHKYSGHDNNRDAFAQNLVESRYMGQILFHQWMPQSFQDHHHMGSYGARLFIAPYKEPVRPYTDPLIWRELSAYGAAMAYKCEEEGLSGVANATQFPGWGHYGYHWLTNSHNIVGMLSESASARLAAPLYIHETQLDGDGDWAMPSYEQRTYFPNPWKGGWWRLSDIVARQFTIAKAQLDFMAKNRAQVLKNMAQKALRQTDRGANDPRKAFIISAKQHDMGTAQKLVQILLGQGVEVVQASENFTVNGRTYSAGSYVIPLAQPKYGLIMNLLDRTIYPNNPFTRNSKGALVAFDVAADTVAEYMGVACEPANGAVEGHFEAVTAVKPISTEIQEACGYVISAKENGAYKTVNILMKHGYDVYRIDACPWHDFYVEGSVSDLAPIIGNSVCRPVNTRPDGLTPAKPLKIAVYQRYYAGNADEGWLRLVLENFGYDYVTIFDKDIHAGELDNFDVLILPNDSKDMIHGPRHAKDNPEMDMIKTYYGTQAEGYDSGLGDEGADMIKAFVQKGGRLLAVGRAALYAIDKLSLGVKDVTHKLGADKFATHGSTLRVNFDNTQDVAYGMPKEGLILHWDTPVFAVTDRFKANDYSYVVKFRESEVLQSGMLTGEDLIKGKGAVVKAKIGNGEVVLYGFSPTFRAQTHGTFKLMFNMLYK